MHVDLYLFVPASLCNVMSFKWDFSQWMINIKCKLLGTVQQVPKHKVPFKNAHRLSDAIVTTTS